MKMEDKNREEADKLFTDLIKTIDLEEPSPKLIDKIVTQYLSQEKFTAFRVARLPLFLLGGLFFLLFLPLLIASWTEMSFNTPTLSLMNESYFELSLWYLVCPIFLLLSITLLVQLELRATFYTNSKNSII